MEQTKQFLPCSSTSKVKGHFANRANARFVVEL